MKGFKFFLVFLRHCAGFSPSDAQRHPSKREPRVC